MKRWMKAYWVDEDVWYHFEVDDDATVLRQVEIRGAGGEVLAASSLDETMAAQCEGRLRAYEEQYGSIADQPAVGWDCKEMPLTYEEFERTWRDARASLRGRTDRISD